MTDNKNNNNKPDGKDKSKHPLLDPTQCKDLKERHDACFNKWYTNSFLKGDASMECVEEWEEYQVCIKDKLKEWNLSYLVDKEKKSEK